MPLVLPNFLVIGAARSGTTTLHSWLRDHPQIYVPYEKVPEPHYFFKSAEYEKGLSYYSTRWFGQWNGEPSIGEVSSSYLFQRYAADRIREHLPAVKLIVILRHPVERAYSSYWFTRKNKLETLSFDEAIRREPERVAQPESAFWAEVQPHAYAGRSRYGEQLSYYRRHFADDQILVCLFEDLVARPLELARTLFRFLDVDESFVPPSINDHLNATEGTKPPMKPETRALLLDQFRDGNRYVADYLRRDLSAWDL